MPGGSGGAGVVELHRSRFVEWQPAGVVALAASGDGSVVAAAREDGDIELYETSTNHCFQRIPGHRDSCLTCVALVDEQESKGGLTSRLFSGGLDGALVEWDVEQRCAGQAADSLGGAVWQLVPEPGACISPGTPARVAAACDDGCARIFQAEAGLPGLIYSKTLPRVEGRTLAAAWHPSGEMLATAGTDCCIHLWSINSGHEVLRITAGNSSGHGAEACIWALLVLPDGTVVSGDSSGNVQFWDGQNGTLLAAFLHHQADVLQLAASHDGSMVFAAGVDSQISLFQRLRDSGSSSSSRELPWAFLSSKRTHSHDVRAMCVAAGRHVPEGARLFTGGNDTQLFSHSLEQYLQEHPFRVNAYPQLPLLQAVCSTPDGSSRQQQMQQQPLLFCVQRSELDVWQLPIANSPMQLGPPAEGMLLSASAPPEHLLQLVVQSGRHINAACISQCGRWLAYSDPQRVRCFSLVQRPADELVPSNHIMPAPLQLPAVLPPACHLAFRPGTSQLITCGSDGIFYSVDLAAWQARQSQQGSSDSGSSEVMQAVRAVHDLQYKSSSRRDRQRSAARRLMPAVELIAISPNGSWLAVAVRQRVHLLSLETHKLVHSLPPLAEPQPPVTALAFTADSITLVVAVSTHQIAAYDIQLGQPTEWSQKHTLPSKVLKMPGNIVSITSSPAAPNSLFLASSEACCHLDMDQVLDCGEHDGQGRKRRRGALMPALASEPPGGNCRMMYCSDPVLYATYLKSEVLLVVERPWQEVLKRIAAPMYRHRYGT